MLAAPEERKMEKTLNPLRGELHCVLCRNSALGSGRVVQSDALSDEWFSLLDPENLPRDTGTSTKHAHFRVSHFNYYQQ